MEIEKLAEELDELRTAHRALAAQHLALITAFRCVMPVICRPHHVAPALQIGGTTTDALMAEQGYDQEFQADVRAWLAVLADACGTELT